MALSGCSGRQPSAPPKPMPGQVGAPDAVSPAAAGSARFLTRRRSRFPGKSPELPELSPPADRSAAVCDVACCQEEPYVVFPASAREARRLCFLQGDADATDEGPARAGRRACGSPASAASLACGKAAAAAMRPAGSRTNSASISPATPRSCGWGCRSTTAGGRGPGQRRGAMPTWTKLWRRSGMERIQRLDALDRLFVEKETELRSIRNNVRQWRKTGNLPDARGFFQPAARPRRGGRGTQGTFRRPQRFAAGAGGAEGRRNPIGQPQEHRGARL